MTKHPHHRCGSIDSRLLREISDAAEEFRRTRGAEQMAAVHRYIIALHRFTNRALERLASRRR